MPRRRQGRRDLGVTVGDTATLEHPKATSTGLRTMQKPVRVARVRPNPMGMLAYLDQDSAIGFGLTGTANLLTVTAAAEVSP